MSKKIKRTVFAGSVAALLAATYFFWYKPMHAQQAPHAMPPMEVTTITIKKAPVQLYVELPGRVTAQKISAVRPQIEGVLKKIKFTEGSFVKEGQQLYQIDPAIYQEAYNSAQRNLKSIKAKRDRYKKLLEFDAVSKQEMDDIEASYASAKSDAQRAKTNIDYTKVLAPISGYIGKSNITEGTLVTANQSEVLTTITQLDPIYVDMAQPSKDMVAMGDQNDIAVSVTTDDPTYENTGKLKFSEVFADESTDSVRLRAIFSNKDKKLIPGMFITGKLHLKPFDAVTVPQRAATRMPDGSLIVWVVDQNNVAKSRPIKAEQITGDSWIVAEGLSEGDVVIYEGFQKIADGATVKPVALKVEEKAVTPNPEQKQQ